VIKASERWGLGGCSGIETGHRLEMRGGARVTRLKNETKKKISERGSPSNKGGESEKWGECRTPSCGNGTDASWMSRKRASDLGTRGRPLGVGGRNPFSFKKRPKSRERGEKGRAPEW